MVRYWTKNMNENLIGHLTIATFKCLLIILPLFYCIGLSNLYLVTYLVRSIAPNYNLAVFTNEDILVASLAFFSVVIYCLKINHTFPSLNLIFAIALGFCLLACLLWLLTKRQFTLPLKNTNLGKINIIVVVFLIYLIRALFKARSLGDVPYIPTRSNTDIFLYLRRISVFLSDPQLSDRSYNSVLALDILYASPKLLSSFVYAVFARICDDPGIAGTILTSFILAVIVSKYIYIFQQSRYFNYKIIYCAVLVFWVFYPSLSYLQDQFYYSNLLSVYLLLYCLQDFFQEQKVRSISFFKFILTSIAVTGFYPSQLPFFAASYCLCALLFTSSYLPKKKYFIYTSIATLIIGLFFFGQYTKTTETLAHFNLFDAEHGVNLVYMPIWALLYLTPKPGAVPKDLGSFLLISVSLIITLVLFEYLSRKNKYYNNYYRLFSFLYLLYSLAYLILPGSYRQGKFLLLYIIPLGIYCFLKAIDNERLAKNKVTIFLSFILAVYVCWSSLGRGYENHLNIAYLELVKQSSSEVRSIQVYNPAEDISYTDIYLANQFPNIRFELIDRCPSIDVQNWQKVKNSITIISQKCPKITLPKELNSKIIYKVVQF
jgi:hypothetical protein